MFIYAKNVTESMIEMKIKSLVKINLIANLVFILESICQNNKLDNTIIMIHLGGQQNIHQKGRDTLVLHN